MKSEDFEVSRRVIGCAMSVHGALGCGFLESVYENALAIELQKKELYFQRQVRLLVRYQEKVVGDYFADVIVEDELLLELKALNSLNKTCESQLLNYLKASNIQVGLLINFGTTSLQVKRMTLAKTKMPLNKSAQSA